ncbi:viperin family antiviral radical SAM protein [Sedimenticola hydrogenitrophicus]|uniref:viperin family antiviral radical SAM protein n=1 Tax=Sedimenticola hydrogenitrophicus TaxID=2967975 RepID=UPI0023B0CE58|nr:viperin family antiviral radical SAM protein [Sedimenticola hydrogenitrophicus]
MQNPTPLVINWHLTEACNYRCRYCYAAWNESVCSRELVHAPERSAALLAELYQFFRPGNSTNPLNSQMAWKSVRLNLAGGEPLLHAGKLPAIVSQARDFGFEVSLISNGSYLDADLLDQLAPQLSWLGISIDSACPSTNRNIGRIDRRGRFVDLDRLVMNLRRTRRGNSGLRLKLNTVVNRLNHREDLCPLIQSFAPDKWKVLRMLPVVNQDLVINDQQFSAFLTRHSALARILCAEDNQDMRESYLMIDPHGRFFQNSPLIAGQGYTYSRPILRVGARAAFDEMAFDPKRFRTRYISFKGRAGA